MKHSPLFIKYIEQHKKEIKTPKQEEIKFMEIRNGQFVGMKRF